MSSVESPSVVYKNVETRGQIFNFVSRNNIDGPSSLQNAKGKDNPIHFEDKKFMEKHLHARAQEKEIQYLREQIALASIRESQMLNEKYALERKISELRMALDEKQGEVIASASNELARRKSDIEVNYNLFNELKATEDEKYIFTSSMLGILAEFGALPHATNASALTNGIKHLHDQLQLRIRTSHARVTELNAMIGNNSRFGFVEKEISSSSPVGGQFSGNSMNPSDYHHSSHNVDGENFALADEARKASTQKLSNNESLPRNFSDAERSFSCHDMNNMLLRNGFKLESEGMTADQFSQPQMLHDRNGSFSSKEDGPGIDGFQITGDAKPGFKLLGCGYPAQGTSLCMFQWVRHLPDGTRQYIEGATNPEYLVTVDDVDKLIAVECIPMDEQGRQGHLVRAFANDHNKITCDEEMQRAIDGYVSNGVAAFQVLILLEENWEPASLSLRRSGFQVKVRGDQGAVISERYSEELLIIITGGLTSQFVLTCANGTSYPFSTNNDIRMRDTLVLTMRMFQAKALDEKRKSKA